MLYFTSKMNIDLISQFGKKNIPDIRPGDTVRVFYKITEGSKTRIQAFEGHNQTLNIRQFQMILHHQSMLSFVHLRPKSEL